MGYVRCDVECKPSSPQPSSVSRTDAYGNSYEDWCADYNSVDVDCAPIVLTTYECVAYEAHTWKPTDVDNNPRTLDPFNPIITLLDGKYPTIDVDIPVDETDILFAVMNGGVAYGLIDETNTELIIPEPDTDIVIRLKEELQDGSNVLGLVDPN